MKKILFSVAVCSLLMISCNNEMESDLAKIDNKITTKAFVNDADFQIVNYFNSEMTPYITKLLPNWQKCQTMK